MIRSLLVALLLVVSSASLSATDYFTMNCGTNGAGGANGRCGFDTENTSSYGVWVNRSFVSAGCPDGTDSVRWDFIESGTHNQFGFGYEQIEESFNPTQGGRWFLKYRLKVPTTTWAGNAPESTLYMKFLVISGVDGGGGDRLITDLRPVVGAVLRSQYNVGGGPDAEVPYDTWVPVIQEYQTATTTTSNDGVLRVWTTPSAGAFVEANPDSENTGLDIEDNAARNEFKFGNFTQGSLAIGGDFAYELCNVVLTDTFDTAWPTVGGGPSTPATIRLRLHGNATPMDRAIFWAGFVGVCCVIVFRPSTRRG